MSTLYEDLPLTNFPSDGVDTFPTYLNVTATDGPLIQQYMEAINAGNQVLANQILAQIPAAEQKVIKATDLNKVMQATLAVERFYKDDIYDYIAQEQQNWENIINQFTYKGIYSSGNTYQKYNMVGYTTNGSTLVYIAIQDVPTGNAPLNETFWRIMTIQGQEGEPGVGLSYRLEWNPATQYEPNQAVTYDGVLWMALQTNINVQPGTDDNIWEKVLDFTVATYPIQPTQPTNLPVGGLWFNTEGNPTQYYYLTPLQSPATAGEIGTGYQAYDSEGNVIMGTATLNGPTYTAGGGIEIASDVISAKISTDANNKVEFGTDGGLFVDTGVDGAVQGNFVGFGADGQLIDSGSKASDFILMDSFVSITANSAEESYEDYVEKLQLVYDTLPNNSMKFIYIYPPEVYGLGTSLYIMYKNSSLYGGISPVANYDAINPVQIVLNNGVWQKMDWVNPNLSLNKEYRTIERYNGKPIYKQLFNFGNLPNTTTKSISTNITNCIPLSVYGTDSEGNTIPQGDMAYAYATSTEIKIKTNYDASSKTATVVLKYIKSTD